MSGLQPRDDRLFRGRLLAFTLASALILLIGSSPVAAQADPPAFPTPTPIIPIPEPVEPLEDDDAIQNFLLLGTDTSSSTLPRTAAS